MDAVTVKDQQALGAQLADSRERLVEIARDLRALDAELDSIAPERNQHALLLEVCNAIGKLNAAGGASLFWGEEAPASASDDHIRRVHSRAEVFNARVNEIEERRQAVLDRVKEQQEHTDLLEDELFEAQEEEER